MSTDTESLLKALGRLAIAVRSSSQSEARRAADELAALRSLPPWLPEEELQYYVGIARYHAGDLQGARQSLSYPLLQGAWAAEAQWLLSKLAASSAAPRTEIFDHYRRLAHLYPLSSLVAVVAAYDTDQRTARDETLPESIPQTKYGRRFDWQKLVQVADLYRQQNLFAEAAEAYGWSVQVRYPDEWFQAGVARTWWTVAECQENRGERGLAARYLLKIYALPADPSLVAAVAQRLPALEQPPAGRPPEPRPDKDKLIQAGDLLAGMELAEQAVAAYRRAAAEGADGAALRIAVALEKKAQFLLDYRSERTPAAVLFGSPLTWDKVEQAFLDAEQAFTAAGGPPDALARCAAGLQRARELHSRGR